MSTTEQDAWDECGGCGHDREDHDRAGCRVTTLSPRGSASCQCLGFVEETDA